MQIPFLQEVQTERETRGSLRLHRLLTEHTHVLLQDIHRVRFVVGRDWQTTRVSCLFNLWCAPKVEIKHFPQVVI